MAAKLAPGHVRRMHQSLHHLVADAPWDDEVLLDRALGVLRHGASPTLPSAFSGQIDGLPVGEGMGACGTAAARGEVVVVEDVLNDALTVPFNDLAQRFDLGSVWSHPLRRVGGVLRWPEWGSECRRVSRL